MVSPRHSEMEGTPIMVSPDSSPALLLLFSSALPVSGPSDHDNISLTRPHTESQRLARSPYRSDNANQVCCPLLSSDPRDCPTFAQNSQLQSDHHIFISKCIRPDLPAARTNLAAQAPKVTTKSPSSLKMSQRTRRSAMSATNAIRTVWCVASLVGGNVARNV